MSNRAQQVVRAELDGYLIALERRVIQLEHRVQQLEARAAAVPARRRSAGPPGPPEGESELGPEASSSSSGFRFRVPR